MRTREDLDRYINDMRNAVRYSGPRLLYFPQNKDARKKGNIRLARELGYGLKDFARKDVERILGNLYGIFIVANSFDNTGVQINAKEFITHLNLPRQSEGAPPAGGL